MKHLTLTTCLGFLLVCTLVSADDGDDRETDLPVIYKVLIGDKEVSLSVGEEGTVALGDKSYLVKLVKSSERSINLAGLKFSVPGELPGTKKKLNVANQFEFTLYEFSTEAFTYEIRHIEISKLTAKQQDAINNLNINYAAGVGKVAEQLKLKLISRQDVELEADSGVSLTGEQAVWEGEVLEDRQRLTFRNYEVRHGGHLFIFNIREINSVKGQEPQAKQLHRAEKLLLESIDII